jgi:hypothetical protein
MSLCFTNNNTILKHSLEFNLLPSLFASSFCYKFLSLVSLFVIFSFFDIFFVFVIVRSFYDPKFFLGSKSLGHYKLICFFPCYV